MSIVALFSAKVRPDSEQELARCEQGWKRRRDTVRLAQEEEVALPFQDNKYSKSDGAW